MNPQIRVEGLELVTANMRRVARGYPREQVNIHRQIGEPIIQRARGRVRVRTGRLRSSIRLRSTPQLVEITADAPYAKYQHYGTRYMSGTRFLSEPLRELEGKLVRDYQDLTNRYVDRTWVSN